MDATAQIAGWGLPDREVDPPSSPLTDADWWVLLTNVRRHRIEGLLVAAVAEGWPCTDPQRAQVLSAHRRAMGSALVLEQLLLELADRLDEAGVRWRVVKGPASAHLDYPDPALRSFGDIDVLVAGADLPRAYSLLESMGGRRRHQAGRLFDVRFGKGAAFSLPTGGEVDLHRTLCLGPYGLALDPDLLFTTPHHFTLAGRRLPALDTTGRFLHACYHSALSGPNRRLAAVRDVAQLTPTTRSDALVALSLARAADGVAVVARALAATAASLAWQPGGTVGELLRWGRELQPSRRDRRWLASYDRGGEGSRARTALALEALPTTKDRLLYAGSVLGPTAMRKVRTTDRRARRS